MQTARTAILQSCSGLLFPLLLLLLLLLAVAVVAVVVYIFLNGVGAPLRTQS